MARSGRGREPFLPGVPGNAASTMFGDTARPYMVGIRGESVAAVLGVLTNRIMTVLGQRRRVGTFGADMAMELAIEARNTEGFESIHHFTDAFYGAATDRFLRQQLMLVLGNFAEVMTQSGSPEWMVKDVILSFHETSAVGRALWGWGRRMYGAGCLMDCNTNESNCLFPLRPTPLTLDPAKKNCLIAAILMAAWEDDEMQDTVRGWRDRFFPELIIKAEGGTRDAVEQQLDSFSDSFRRAMGLPLNSGIRMYGAWPAITHLATYFGVPIVCFSSKYMDWFKGTKHADNSSRARSLTVFLRFGNREDLNVPLGEWKQYTSKGIIPPTVLQWFDPPMMFLPMGWDRTYDTTVLPFLLKAPYLKLAVRCASSRPRDDFMAHAFNLEHVETTEDLNRWCSRCNEFVRPDRWDEHHQLPCSHRSREGPDGTIFFKEGIVKLVHPFRTTLPGMRVRVIGYDLETMKYGKMVGIEGCKERGWDPEDDGVYACGWSDSGHPDKLPWVYRKRMDSAVPRHEAFDYYMSYFDGDRTLKGEFQERVVRASKFGTVISNFWKPLEKFDENRYDCDDPLFMFLAYLSWAFLDPDYGRKYVIRVVAHNGSRYDHFFLLQAMARYKEVFEWTYHEDHTVVNERGIMRYCFIPTWMYMNYTLHGRGSEGYGLDDYGEEAGGSSTIRAKRGTIMIPYGYLLCTLLLCGPQSLKSLAIGFELSTLKREFDHKLMASPASLIEHREKLLKYLEADVRALMGIATYFACLMHRQASTMWREEARQLCNREDRVGLNVFEQLSQAGIAFTLIKNAMRLEYPCMRVFVPTDDLIRRRQRASMYGGRVFVTRRQWKCGVWGTLERCMVEEKDEATGICTYRMKEKEEDSQYNRFYVQAKHETMKKYLRYVDVCSLYPASQFSETLDEMVGCWYPVGQPHELSSGEIQSYENELNRACRLGMMQRRQYQFPWMESSDKRFLFLTIGYMVKNKNRIISPLPQRVNSAGVLDPTPGGHLVYTNWDVDRKCAMSYTQVEILNGIRRGHFREIRIVSGHQYTVCVRLFRNFVPLVMREKDRAEKEGKKAVRAMYKNIANSSYGKMGEKTHQVMTIVRMAPLSEQEVVENHRQQLMAMFFDSLDRYTKERAFVISLYNRCLEMRDEFGAFTAEGRNLRNFAIRRLKKLRLDNYFSSSMKKVLMHGDFLTRAMLDKEVELFKEKVLGPEYNCHAEPVLPGHDGTSAAHSFKREKEMMRRLIQYFQDEATHLSRGAMRVGRLRSLKELPHYVEQKIERHGLTTVKYRTPNVFRDVMEKSPTQIAATILSISKHVHFDFLDKIECADAILYGDTDSAIIEVNDYQRGLEKGVILPDDDEDISSLQKVGRFTNETKDYLDFKGYYLVVNGPKVYFLVGGGYRKTRDSSGQVTKGAFELVVIGKCKGLDARLLNKGDHDRASDMMHESVEKGQEAGELGYEPVDLEMDTCVRDLRGCVIRWTKLRRQFMKNFYEGGWYDSETGMFLPAGHPKQVKNAPDWRPRQSSYHTLPCTLDDESDDDDESVVCYEPDALHSDMSFV